MLQSKLLVIACAFGILSFGACFVPTHYTPPPPLPIVVEGIKSIRIEVVNTLESHHLIANALAAELVMQVNRRLQNYEHITAHLEQQDASNEDAFLQVRILSEGATFPAAHLKDGVPLWKITVSASETLTRTNGQVIWSEAQVDNSFFVHSYASTEEEMWKDPIAQAEAATNISDRLYFELLSQRVAIPPTPPATKPH